MLYPTLLPSSLDVHFMFSNFSRIGKRSENLLFLAGVISFLCVKTAPTSSFLLLTLSGGLLKPPPASVAVFLQGWRSFLWHQVPWGACSNIGAWRLDSLWGALWESAFKTSSAVADWSLRTTDSKSLILFFFFTMEKYGVKVGSEVLTQATVTVLYAWVPEKDGVQRPVSSKSRGCEGSCLASSQPSDLHPCLLLSH